MTQIGEKGSVALADLTQLASDVQQTGVDQLIGWRNFATAQPTGSLATGYTFNTAAASNYNYYVAPPTNSPPTFLSVNAASASASRSDQTFTSRQALIRYQRATYQQPSSAYGFSQDDLQYLGTFTRAMNVPAFVPRATVDPVIAAAVSAGKNHRAHYLYRQQLHEHQRAARGGRGQSRFVPAQRKAVNNRKLSLKPSRPFANPSSAANQALIKTYFGLTYESNHRFSYAEPGGVGSMSIMTLAQVATANPPRQPDFFELLQAAVLSGSLYNYLGVTDNTFKAGKSGSIILHLGADIINQYQPNNFPLVIDYGQSGANPVSTITGTDDLPYFSEMLLWAVSS